MGLKAGDRLGPYEVQSLLGVRGMGEVYRGRDTRLGQHTHGGKRRGSPSSDPFLPPGEFDDGPGWLQEGNRIQKVKSMQVAAGLSVSAGPVDLHVNALKYVWGQDAHNGWSIGTGATWYFGL